MEIAGLIAAESIIAAILLTIMFAQMETWNKNVELYGSYSLTLYLGLVYLGASIITLLRSIASALEYINTKKPKAFNHSYNLLLLSLIATAIYVFVILASPTRIALFKLPLRPIELPAPEWIFPTLFLSLMVYTVILVLKPSWIATNLMNRLKKIFHFLPD